MRVLRAVVAAAATGTMLVTGAVPATGGTGASQACGDHVGYQEVPVNNGIVTVGAELGWSPTRQQNNLILCFSNTTPGVPSTLTGGALWIFYGTNGSTTSPSVYVNTYCDDDLGTQTVDLEYSPFYNCNLPNGLTVTVSSTPVVPSGCLASVVYLGCLYYQPSTISAPLPHVSITVAGRTTGV